MIALLDINAFPFWVYEPAKLSQLAFDFIGDGENQLLLNIAYLLYSPCCTTIHLIRFWSRRHSWRIYPL